MARPRVHLGLALVALASLRRKLTWPGRLAFLTGSVLVDADHLVDYGLRRQASHQHRLVLPLHGWEYVVALWLLGRGPTPWSLARAVALGLLLHLLVDQMTNRPEHPGLYSVLYRASHGFAGEQLSFERGDGQWMQQPWWRWF